MQRRKKPACEKEPFGKKTNKRGRTSVHFFERKYPFSIGNEIDRDVG